jgi:NADP-dependent 3-hydroxy acid dehydrogenase YdfG
MATSNRPAGNQPVWLITGCSSGIGEALARRLLESGFRVAATSRNTKAVEELARAYPDTALALALDVTNRTQIADAVAACERRFGAIDVLVNNAGYGYYASIEEGDDAAMRAMFETNVFGLVAMTQAVLPSMRARHRGHIVNISSIGGLVAYPGSGYYAATKFAVEALSEALSKEVAPLGIRVLIVEPGPFRTRFVENSQGEIAVGIADYADTVGVRRATIQANSGKQAGDPARAAKAIIDAVASDHPPLRLLLGARALSEARSKLESLRQDVDAWEATTRAADFPS